MANFVTFNGKTIRIGDTIQVHYKLIEKEEVAGKAKKEKKEEVRERIQIFEGILIAIKGNNENRMLTVRRIGTASVGVERIFPLLSPWIKNITVKKSAKVRRAKLYYLRKLKGRAADRLKEKVNKKDIEVPESIVHEQPPPTTQS
ncbi:50S ribosomal protein L19 [Candidatus Gottesmanbacteria bacterium RIFCSPHIGHO2_02_FULL_39_11]|uniref:50S ribosomal protein L19 n=1 Tax=Candidatus Gottesmanbacteria bacterium RIFCSPHIGHO2_02_FULL_39_11 TaxID=1798382 RepID=A0A1F5ZT15_9BACT|nr:MAG: 50S ribosomal protein L19 [Candidatus Gottesmanbacteria bacterium RIFCSPHIGHO2_02_FULL_39_11]